MCGIVGIFNRASQASIQRLTLKRMIGMIRHRGPDEFGLYRDTHVGLSSARLSIIDLSSGQQPIGNEDQTLWIVFNGEIYNYLELRSQLEKQGHHFTTQSDTEVILHLYETYGPACLSHLNGQFAVAIWDQQARTLFLARDRLGIRPLYYTEVDGRLIFASEIKAILAHPAVAVDIDRIALSQVFTYWSPVAPRTAFAGIRELPPAHYLLADAKTLTVRRYWEMDFEEAAAPRDQPAYLEVFDQLLTDATHIRLRADVPVGAYLSGGLDSSTITALIRRCSTTQLDTFSITFDDPKFDEHRYQTQMAAALGTQHHIVHCKHTDIARVFPDVIWHTEVPVLRAAPAPMFLLSQLVHDHNLKVVLTGEGADEILAGYNIFKEMKVRRFWAKDPTSQLRPQLLARLYPYIPELSKSAYLTAFFRKGLEETASPTYSHALRWSSTQRLQRCFLRDGGAEPDAGLPFSLPETFDRWSPLAQAQYLEMSLFLPNYLLSSQGDRMATAHSVEGRFPFLDHRVVEFCNRLPAQLKLHGLREKWLLKQLGKQFLPTEIWQRTKQPYRAPVQACFHGADRPEYVDVLLSETALQETGLFKPAAVARLQQKIERGHQLSEMEEMALIGMISSQLLFYQFVRDFHVPTPALNGRVKVVDQLHPVTSGTNV